MPAKEMRGNKEVMSARTEAGTEAPHSKSLPRQPAKTAGLSHEVRPLCEGERSSAGQGVQSLVNDGRPCVRRVLQRRAADGIDEATARGRPGDAGCRLHVGRRVGGQCG